MIEMPCPQCHRELEIDEGFRGGICRCFHCGALLTVPKRTDRDRSEAPNRPEAPAASRDEPAPRAPAPPAKPPREPEAKRADPAPADPDDPRGRRILVRIITVAIVCVLMLGLIGAVIYGMVTLLSGPEPIDADPRRIHAEVFAIDDNPFFRTTPSFMSLPVTGATAIMIDSSAAMRDSLGHLKRAVAHSVETLGEHPVQIIFWNEAGPIAYPDEPTPAARIDAEALDEQLDGVFASGGISAAPAFTEALEGRPDLIMLVARLAPEPEELETIRQRVRESGVRLVAILIDNHDATLAEIAEDSGGRLIELSRRRLQRWYEEYVDHEDGR